MAVQDYMRQGNNGIIQMNCNNLPDKVFIDAIKTKNICKAKILTREERAQLPAGSPDVKVIRITGGSQFITRKQLVEKFAFTNGSSIKVAYLTSGKEYIVYNVCNEKYKVMKLPQNCVGVMNNKKVTQGSYLVVPVNADGSLNKSEMGVVSSGNFRKCFKIPMQNVIQRHIGGGSKTFSLFNRAPQRPRIKPVSTDSMRNMSNMGNMGSMSGAGVNLGGHGNMQGLGSIKPSSTMEQTPRPVQKPIQTPRPMQTQQNNNGAMSARERIEAMKNKNNNYKYTAVNRLFDINNNQVGFTIGNLSNGATKQIDMPTMYKLCKEKIVDNVMLVTMGNTGKWHLRGNGINLETLPKVLR